MNKQYYAALALALAGALLVNPATAEEIALPLGQQGEQNIDKPPRGTNKTQVEAVYGEPNSKHGPTGEPPIYRWEYSDYTVYFEGDHVVHTVLKHRRKDN